MLSACSGSSSTAPSGNPSSRSSPSGASSAPASGAPAGPHSSAIPPATPGPTSVAPPVPGNIHQTVAPGSASPLHPVPLASPVRFPTARLVATIADPARVQAQAHIPGEIAGPALSFTLQLTNRGHRGLDLGTNIAVTAQDAAGQPFTVLTTSTQAVGGTLRPGAHASGHYEFHLPDNTKNPVTIVVTYAATTEVARFVGPIS